MSNNINEMKELFKKNSIKDDENIIKYNDLIDKIKKEKDIVLKLLKDYKDVKKIVEKDKYIK